MYGRPIQITVTNATSTETRKFSRFLESPRYLRNEVLFRNAQIAPHNIQRAGHRAFIRSQHLQKLTIKRYENSGYVGALGMRSIPRYAQR